MKSKIVIAEDQTIVRKGLRSLLESEENIEVVAEAGDGIETIKCVEQHSPDGSRAQTRNNKPTNICPGAIQPAITKHSESQGCVLRRPTTGVAIRTPWPASHATHRFPSHPAGSSRGTSIKVNHEYAVAVA